VRSHYATVVGPTVTLLCPSFGGRAAEKCIYATERFTP
jgi:hypothetical protein